VVCAGSERGGNVSGVRIDLDDRVESGTSAIDRLDSRFVVTLESPNVEASGSERAALLRWRVRWEQDLART